MNTILAIDIDRWAIEAYRANFPDTEVRRASVTDEIANLRQGQADIITGGFPCQPHSLAGKRKASNDARDCGPDFVAAIAKAQPRMFLGENVSGILSSENGRYVQRLLKSMEDAGYVVEIRTQDAVSFGVPQFRVRVWFWGIRRDLYAADMRHRWPKATHTWPPPDDCMFGSALAAGVTCGEALGLHVIGGMRAGGPRHEVADRLLSYEPAQTIGDLSHGLRNCEPRIIGGGRNDIDRGDGHFNRNERDITNEPCTTIAGTHLGTHKGAQNPRIQLYHWSDAMLQKHPPASPASPAPTVQAKWFKGGAEGLLQWKRTKDGLWVRRLTPFECARLQSMPDDYRWPEGITKTAMYRIIGNGQASQHVAALARAMASVDPEARTMLDLFCGGGLGACGFHQRYWSYERDVLALEASCA